VAGRGEAAGVRERAPARATDREIGVVAAVLVAGSRDDRYPTTLLNSRTVSIEHHDNGGRTAGNGKGVVPEAVIAASIALDALLLRGVRVCLRGRVSRTFPGAGRGSRQARACAPRSAQVPR